jgi:hypothetical protein
MANNNEIEQLLFQIYNLCMKPSIKGRLFNFKTSCNGSRNGCYLDEFVYTIDVYEEYFCISIIPQQFVKSLKQRLLFHIHIFPDEEKVALRKYFGFDETIPTYRDYRQAYKLTKKLIASTVSENRK